MWVENKAKKHWITKKRWKNRFLWDFYRAQDKLFVLFLTVMC